jgi:hypothetical protein
VPAHPACRFILLPGERFPTWPPEALVPPSRLRLVVLSGESSGESPAGGGDIFAAACVCGEELRHREERALR